MKLDQQALWQQLHNEGMVQGEMPDAQLLDSPWYVRGLVGFSGWLAAAFMLGFISAGFEFVFDNPLLAIALGLAMLGMAYKMLASKQINDFTSQFALATSFAGQSLVAYGLFDTNNTYEGVDWLIIAGLQGVLAWYLPNSLHRIWSAFAASMAVCFALAYGHLYFIQSSLLMLAVAFVWLHELDWLARQDKIKPIAYGLTLALIYQACSGQFYSGMLDLMLSTNVKHGLWDSPWMGELLSGLVMLALVWTLLKQAPQAVSKKILGAALFATLLLVLASFEARGLSIGIMIMLLGYANGNRLLTGLGMVSMLFYIMAYYYMLDTSLLDKARLLLVLGMLLIAARFAMHYSFSSTREANHA